MYTAPQAKTHIPHVYPHSHGALPPLSHSVPNFSTSGSNVIPRRARPGLAGLRPHNIHHPPHTSPPKHTTLHTHHPLAPQPLQGYLAHKKHPHPLRITIGT